MINAVFIRFFLFACLTFFPLIRAKDVFEKRGLAYGNWSKSDADIWDAQKSPLTWYYNVSRCNTLPCQRIEAELECVRLKMRLMTG